jgi:hypothetical protein
VEGLERRLNKGEREQMRRQGLTPGKLTLEFDLKYDGFGIGTLAFNSVSGIGRSGMGVLKVDGRTERPRERIACSARERLTGLYFSGE